MKVAHFINMFMKRGGKSLTSLPAPGVDWDWYGIVRQMTEEIDFNCQFDKYAPGCRGHESSKGACCCGGCFSSMGFLSVLPNDYTILTAIAKIFVEPEAIGTTTATGFWKKGVGCRLPRRYRSLTCLRHYCGDPKMSKEHHYLIKKMLYPSSYVKHRNGFLELYPTYGGKLPTRGKLTDLFKQAFWNYVDSRLQQGDADVNTPQHIRARKVTLSEIERAIYDGDWKKLKDICNLYGTFGPVDDPHRLQEMVKALIDRCERENWKGDVSTKAAVALANVLVANKKTSTVHVGAESNVHGTLCDTWSWGSDMYVTTAMNVTCKRCLNILKIQEVL